MSNRLNNAFERTVPKKSGARIRITLPASVLSKKSPPQKRGQTFSKVFHWRLPDGQSRAPASVEIAGSFTRWQKVPLTRINEFDGWSVILHDIPGHRTHHYMLLVDGKPAHDENADGMAIPHGPLEEQHQLMTAKGGRVFMLCAQTK